MVLFSLFSLMDTTDAYKHAMWQLIRRRHETLYRNIGLRVEWDPDSAGYYAELSLDEIGRQLYRPEFVKWLMSHVKPGELLYRIADEAGVVLMPGGGFGDTRPAARVSLANLNESAYAAIGTAIRRLLDEYYARFQGRKSQDTTLKRGETKRRK